MRKILFIIAVTLIGIWAIGFFLFNVKNAIHLLPIMAVIALMRGLINDEEPEYIRKNHSWKIQD